MPDRKGLRQEILKAAHTSLLNIHPGTPLAWDEEISGEMGKPM